jgi:hypothetical protein
MRKLSLLMIVGAVLALGSGIAAAATGSLTTFEYQQLVYTRNKLKTASGINAAIFDCEQIQMQSKLLTDERSDCISQLRLEQSTGEMKAYAKDCLAYSSAVARLKCLLPPYEQLYKTYATYYRAESQIHALSIARGLGEPCADELSDTPVVISDEKVVLDAIGLIIRAAKTGNVAGFESSTRTVVAGSADISKGQQANTAPPSICPHPGSKTSTGKPSV